MSLPSEYVTAVYQDTGNPSYNGNPFIEALPPIMEIKQLKEGLEGKVTFSLNNLQDKPRQRAHMVAALLHDFFQPLSQHVLLEVTYFNHDAAWLRWSKPNGWIT